MPSGLSLNWGYALFLAGAGVAYFVPLFRPRALWPQFASVLAVAAVLPRQASAAFLLALAFYLLLGIKDLHFLDRETAYEVLAFLLLFAGGWSLYHAVLNWGSLLTIGLAMAGLALVFYIVAEALPWGRPSAENRGRMSPVLAALLFFEAGTIIFFLPFDYLFQALLLFLVGVFLVLGITYFRKGEADQRLLRYAFGSMAVAMGFVLVLSGWGM